MNTPPNQQPFQGITTAFLRWNWIWIASTALCSVAGLLYVQLLQPRQWTATQRLIIDEDLGEKLLDFASSPEFLDSTAKQTSLEFSQNRNAAIDASKLELRLTCVPAEGSDGYRRESCIAVQVTANSKQQVTDLATEVAKAAEKRLREATRKRLEEEAVRSERLAQAVASELETAEKLLAELPIQAEQELGIEVKDVVWSTGDSSLKRKLDRIRIAADHLEDQRLALKHERKRIKQLLDNPAGLLEQRVSEKSHNAKLAELRGVWATSLTHITELQSRYTEAHPLVIAARETERSLAAQVNAELESARVLLEKELSANQADIAAIEEEQVEAVLAIGQLKSFLDQYADAIDLSKHKRVELRTAESAIALALARREAIATASLVTSKAAPKLAAVEPGVAGSTVVAGATLSGLILGFGLILLFKPPHSNLKRSPIEGPLSKEFRAETEANSSPTLSRKFEAQEELVLNELAATVTELWIANDSSAIAQDTNSPEETKEKEAEPQQLPAELVGASTMTFSEEANSPPQPK